MCGGFSGDQWAAISFRVVINVGRSHGWSMCSGVSGGQCAVVSRVVNLRRSLGLSMCGGRRCIGLSLCSGLSGGQCVAVSPVVNVRRSLGWSMWGSVSDGQCAAVSRVVNVRQSRAEKQGSSCTVTLSRDLTAFACFSIRCQNNVIYLEITVCAQGVAVSEPLDKKQINYSYFLTNPNITFSHGCNLAKGTKMMKPLRRRLIKECLTKLFVIFYSFIINVTLTSFYAASHFCFIRHVFAINYNIRI